MDEITERRSAWILWLRRSVAALALLGAAVFATAFVASLRDPGLVERQARVAIEAEVRERVGERIADLGENPVVGFAQRLLEEKRAEVAARRQALLDKLPQRIAERLAELRDLDCTCRQQVESSIESGMRHGLDDARAVEARLDALIRSQYMEVAGKLTREFRIFTASNAGVLLFLGLAVLLRRKAGLHLLPAATVLLLASLWVGYLHLFRQDWLHTIVFSDYTGLWYLAYLGAAAVLLGDLFLNRGRWTAHAINAVAGLVGGALSLASC